MFTQSTSRVQGADAFACDDLSVAQGTNLDPPIRGECRHCGMYARDLQAHLDAQRAKERKLFLLQDQLTNSRIDTTRASKGGEARMMRIISIVGISWGGVIGLAIARGKDQMQRLEALMQAYRTTAH